MLQRLEHHCFGFGQREGFVEFVLQLCLRAFGAGADGFGVVAVEGSGGFGVVSVFGGGGRLVGRVGVGEGVEGVGEDVQLRSFLVDPSNQERYSEWPAHDTLLALGALAKPQRQIANRLCAALDPQRFVVVESVVLALDAGVLDHRAGVGL